MSALLAEVAASFMPWLLRTSWQAALLAGGILLARAVLRHHLSPGWRQALWLLLLLKLMLPAVPATRFSPHDVLSLSLELREASPVVSAKPSAPVESSAAQLSAVISDGAIAKAPRFSPLEWGALIWAGGVLLLGGWGVGGQIFFSRRLRSARPLADAAVRELARQCATEVGLKRLPAILETRQVATPALFGLFRARLLLPHGLGEHLRREELRLVFLHEFAHLRRGDLYLNTLASFLQLLHWFNPLLWWAFNRMRHDRELATDAHVLALGGPADRRVYGETLLRLVEGVIPAPCNVVGIIDDTHNLRDRLIAIRRPAGSRPRRVVIGAALLLLLSFTALTKEPLPAPSPPESESERKPDDAHLYLAGRRLSEDEAKALEAEIAKAPDAPESLNARKKLLSYYGRAQSKKREALLLWFIEKHPADSFLLGSYSGHISKILHPSEYRKVSAAWDAQLKANPKSPQIIANAAAFYLIEGRERSRELYEKGRALEPENPEWISRLANLYMLDGAPARSVDVMGGTGFIRAIHRMLYSQNDAKVAAKKEFELREELLIIHKANREKIFYEMGAAANSAFNAGEKEKAAKYAEELLRMAPDFPKNWNYGNAIYTGHHLLGLLALQRGDLEEAKKQLLAAGKTRGSPGLGSFGPDFRLAQALVEKGEVETVLQFLDEVARFWKNDRLRVFRAEVESKVAK